QFSTDLRRQWEYGRSRAGSEIDLAPEPDAPSAAPPPLPATPGVGVEPEPVVEPSVSPEPQQPASEPDPVAPDPRDVPPPGPDPPPPQPLGEPVRDEECVSPRRTRCLSPEPVEGSKAARVGVEFQPGASTSSAHGRSRSPHGALPPPDPSMSHARRCGTRQQ